MIQANELRLGNKMLYTNSNGDSEIIGCNVFHLADLSGQTDEAKPEMAERYSPIPLTPEILEKCGFKLWDNDWYFTKLEWLELSINIESGEICIQPIKHGSQLFSGVHLYCKSLHQLQNLYFALTGKELEFKP